MRKTLLKYAKRILVVSMVTVMMSSSLTAYGKTKEVTPMNGWRYAKKTANYQVNSTSKKYKNAKIPKITKVKVKYSGKKIYVTGNSKGLKYVTGVYGKVKKTSKVDSDKFKIVFAYTDRKDITLSGLNSKKEKISKKKTVKAEKYITDAPVCEKAKKTAKGVRYSVKTVANSTLIFKYNGKIVKKCYIDSSYDTITIKDKVLKGKKGYMKVTQKQKNKRVSKSVKFKILKNDEASQMSY